MKSEGATCHILPCPKQLSYCKKKNSNLTFFLSVKVFAISLHWLWGRVGVWLVKNSRYNIDKQNSSPSVLQMGRTFTFQHLQLCVAGTFACCAALLEVRDMNE